MFKWRLLLIGMVLIFLHFNIVPETGPAQVPETASTQKSLEDRCKESLGLDIKEEQSRNQVISIIDEISKQENLYLISGLYPEIRQYYEKLQVKLAKFYIEGNDYKKALERYVEADKYAVRGYKSDLASCRENMAENMFNKIISHRQGESAYQTFLKEYEENEKKYYWEYFLDTILKLYDKNDMEKILLSFAFWKHFKNDTFFNSGNSSLGFQKKKVDGIFEKMQEQYKQSLIHQMASLYPIDINSQAPLEKIIRFTDDSEFVNKIKAYAGEYNRLKDYFLRETPDINQLKAQVQKIYKYGPVSPEIKDKLDQYINQWNAYYLLKEGDTYAQKETAGLKRKELLTDIKQMAQQVGIFDLAQRVSHINRLIKHTEESVNKWRIHEEVDAAIVYFEKNRNPTIEELYKVKQQIMRKTKALPSEQLEQRLFLRAELFLNIPAKKNLNIDSLENYLKYLWKNDNRVVSLLKGEFAQRLLAHLEQQMDYGGNSRKDLEKVKQTAARYQNFFKKKISQAECIAMLEKYYRAQDIQDYPGLMELYQGSPGITTACSLQLMQKWNVMTREKVKVTYQNYFQAEVNKVLGDNGQKNQSHFIEFEKLYKHARRYFPLKGECERRYVWLAAYYGADSSISKEEAVRELYRNFPNLAISYSIPQPEDEITPISDNEVGSEIGVKKSPPEIGIKNQSRPDPIRDDYNKSVQMQNQGKIISKKPKTIYKQRDILEFLDTVFSYVKNSQLDDPALEAMCRRLVDSKLNGPEFNEIRKKYREKIPVEYDLVMNLFFRVIHVREKKWQDMAAMIIESGNWADDVKEKMQDYLEIVRTLFK